MRGFGSTKAIACAIVAIGGLAAAGCGSSNSAANSGGSGGGGSSSGGGGAAKGAPVKLGAIFTVSGPFAEVGDDNEAGAKLAIQQINAAGGVDGHKLQLVVKDEAASPTTTVSDVRSLTGAGVKMIMGGTDDSDCLAMAPQISDAGGVLVGTACQTNLLETTKFVPGFFSLVPSNYMLSKAAAQFAKEHFASVKSWDNLGPDYQFGHEVWASFRSDLTKLVPGASYGKSVFPPLTATQYSSYITSLLSGLPSDSAKSTGLFLSTFGSATIALAQQGKSYNFFKRYKAVLNIGGSTPTAAALGANTPPMYFIYDYDNRAYHTAANTAFVKAYEKAHKGKVPDSWAYNGYTAVMAYKAAIEKAKSTSPTAIRSAMAGMTFSTAKGMLTFRKQDHQLETPVTVWGVVGDASAPGHFRITSAEAVPAKEVLPPVKVH